MKHQEVKNFASAAPSKHEENLHIYVYACKHTGYMAACTYQRLYVSECMDEPILYLRDWKNVTCFHIFLFHIYAKQFTHFLKSGADKLLYVVFIYSPPSFISLLTKCVQEWKEVSNQHGRYQ